MRKAGSRFVFRRNKPVNTLFANDGTASVIGLRSGVGVFFNNQKAEPTYAWNNTLNGKPSPMVKNAGPIVEGRDFFNAPMPGYTRRTSIPTR
jgi:hypothetical protein